MVFCIGEQKYIVCLGYSYIIIYIFWRCLHNQKWKKNPNINDKYSIKIINIYFTQYTIDPTLRVTATNQDVTEVAFLFYKPQKSRFTGWCHISNWRAVVLSWFHWAECKPMTSVWTCLCWLCVKLTHLVPVSSRCDFTIFILRRKSFFFDLVCNRPFSEQ